MGSFLSPALRDRVRAAAEPIARTLGRLGLSPNALTLIGFGIAVLAAFAAATQAWLLAGLLTAFGAVFDLFDGVLARATGTSSRFGAFIDSVFDRAGEAVVYAGIAWGATAGNVFFGAPLAAAAMAGAFMVSYTRAKSESLGFTSGNSMASVGLAPREVRVVLLVIGLLAIELGPQIAIGRPWLQLSLGLIAILATLTTIQRIVHVYSQSKKER